MFEIVDIAAYARKAAIIAALAAGLTLASCESGDDASTVTPLPGEPGGLSFEPPELVLTARAVVRENLVLDVQVARLEGEVPQAAVPVEVTEDGGLWRGTINLAPGQSYIATLTWSERLSEAEDPDGVLGADRRLPLAVATREFSVTAGDAVELRVLNREYDSTGEGFDFDDDGVPNLDERRDDTRPLDATSPGTPVVEVPLRATFRLPEGLSDAEARFLDAFDVQVTVGARPMSITREESLWTGTLDVVQGTTPVVAVTFFADDSRTLALAASSRSVEATGNAPSITFETGDYELRNSDGDDFTNFEELVAGTRPFDASDPAGDPCEVSQFETGCEIDTDGDGRFDSQEGESADRDGDGIPDYRESSTVDADDDGRFADNDAEEGDPCLPSADNDACRAVIADQVVPLQATFRLPQGFAGVNDRFYDQFDVQANANGESMAVTRQGTTWIGRRDVERGSTQTVTVTFLDDDDDDDEVGRLTLATASDSVGASGDAPSITFEADDYAIINSDGDDFTNFEELVNGTEPFDASDPGSEPDDPCEVSDFEPGCDTDTDGDGRPDSVEGEDADADDDGIPDFRESSEEDADEDGSSEERDEDENDPCVPSEDNAACQATLDEDEDGIVDGEDNCPTEFNPGQANFDEDSGDDQGDACDSDQDGDGIENDDEADGCELDPDPSCGETAPPGPETDPVRLP